MKKIDELRQALEAKTAEARSLNQEGKVEEAETKLNELRSIKKQIEIQEELDKDEVREVETKVEKRELKQENSTDVEQRNAFIKAIQGKPLNSDEQRALSGLKDADGKVLIPKDIQTKINEYKRDMQSMKQYVRVENVTTPSGTRVFEKLADMTPFASRAELSLIPPVADPQFETVSYSIVDYAGMLKFSNELLEDTPENVMNYIAKHFAKKAVVTENTAIFNLLNSSYATKTAIAAGKEVAGIKKVINVSIDPALMADARIYTNQDGFQYLDTLVDADGRPLMQVDVTNPTAKRLFGREVVVFSNRTLPSAGGKAPMIIGNTQEAVTFFDRKKPELATTNVGGDAFETNSTLVRMVERFDAKIFDKEAVVYAQLTLPTA